MKKLERRYKYSLTGGFIGLILAILIIALGIFKTIMIIILVLLGLYLGMYVEANDYFHRLK